MHPQLIFILGIVLSFIVARLGVFLMLVSVITYRTVSVVFGTACLLLSLFLILLSFLAIIPR